MKLSRLTRTGCMPCSTVKATSVVRSRAWFDGRDRTGETVQDDLRFRTTAGGAGLGSQHHTLRVALQSSWEAMRSSRADLQPSLFSATHERENPSRSAVVRLGCVARPRRGLTHKLVRDGPTGVNEGVYLIAVLVFNPTASIVIKYIKLNDTEESPCAKRGPRAVCRQTFCGARPR